MVAQAFASLLSALMAFGLWIVLMEETRSDKGIVTITAYAVLSLVFVLAVIWRFI